MVDEDWAPVAAAATPAVAVRHSPVMTGDGRRVAACQMRDYFWHLAPERLPEHQGRLCKRCVKAAERSER